MVNELALKDLSQACYQDVHENAQGVDKEKQSNFQISL